MARGRPRSEPCSCRYCDRPARYRVMALCDLHYARQRRSAPMTTPPRVVHYTSAFDRLLGAALACADAETERDYSNAKARLIQGALAYAAAHSTAQRSEAA